MADTSRTQTFDEIVTTTLDSYLPTLTDNIFKSNPTFFEVKRRGMYTSQDGGVSILEPLMYGTNPTVTSYSRYDTFDMLPAEGITAAIFPWTQVGAVVLIDRLSERQNSGKHQIINLLSAKITQAEMSIIEQFSAYLFAAGKYNASQASKDPAGFLALVSETPDSYDVGSIDTSANTWWQNKVKGNAGTTWTWIPDLGDTPADSTGVAAMRTLYNNCSKAAGGSPDIILGTQYWFEQYEAHLSPFKRFTDDAAAEAGFHNLRYRGATCFWDENYRSAGCASAAETLTEAAFMMLNSKFVKLRYDSQTDFIRTDYVRPQNQDAKSCLFLWYGNWTVSNRRKLGIGHDSNLTDIN